MKKKVLILFFILLMVSIMIVSFSILIKNKRIEEKRAINNSFANKERMNTIAYDNTQKENLIVTNEENKIEIQNNISEQQVQLNSNSESNDIMEGKVAISQIDSVEQKNNVGESNIEINQPQEDISRELTEQQVQQQNQVQIETPVENSPQPQPQQENLSEQSKMCIDGGNIHILGDGENEHRLL